MTGQLPAADPPACPDSCPVCGKDLKAEGFPLQHQADPDGKVCPFEWAWT